MNIDEIIRKCVEVPGISIERREYSAGLFLNGKDGKGSVTFFPLFSGLTLAYISVKRSALDSTGSVRRGLRGKRAAASELLRYWAL